MPERISESLTCWEELFALQTCSFYSYREVTKLAAVNKKLSAIFQEINAAWKALLEKITTHSYREQQRKENPKLANRIFLLGACFTEKKCSAFALKIDCIAFVHMTKETSAALPFMISYLMGEVHMETILSENFHQDDVDLVRFYMSIYPFSFSEKQSALLTFATQHKGRALVDFLINEKNVTLPPLKNINIEQFQPYEKGAYLCNFASMQGSESLLKKVLRYHECTPLERGTALMRIGLQKGAEAKKALLCSGQPPLVPKKTYLSPNEVENYKSKVAHYLAEETSAGKIRDFLLRIARFKNGEVIQWATVLIESLEKEQIEFLSFKSIFFKTLLAEKRGLEIIEVFFRTADCSIELMADLVDFMAKNKDLKKSLPKIISAIELKKREKLLYKFVTSNEKEHHMLLMFLLREGVSERCKGNLLLTIFGLSELWKIVSDEEKNGKRSTFELHGKGLGRKKELVQELLEKGKLPKILYEIFFVELAKRKKYQRMRRMLNSSIELSPRTKVKGLHEIVKGSFSKEKLSIVTQLIEEGISENSLHAFFVQLGVQWYKESSLDEKRMLKQLIERHLNLGNISTKVKGELAVALAKQGAEEDILELFLSQKGVIHVDHLPPLIQALVEREDGGKILHSQVKKHYRTIDEMLKGLILITWAEREGRSPMVEFLLKDQQLDREIKRNAEIAIANHALRLAEDFVIVM